MSVVKKFREKALQVKEILKNPFDTKDLELKMAELYELMKGMNREELLAVREDYEEIKNLLNRNIEIVAGGLKPFLKLERGVISRRV